ncbi:phosphatidylinositol-glycan biosynthesis class W protein isoform X2 [Aythya fuligula]|uniref:Phosphatidylinositol-glycan biosynthesis class W protein isoform X2 n=1 Tax=Aythya fuligula TaxID=219594 RepID=A0A6J3DZ99_AYTFU|nr:phosphatidylinositol-glycan biosynthesis class W protein isoform X2 [Aythya fuligula]
MLLIPAQGRRMSQKQLKEAFISNLNGTSLLEVSLGLPLAPLCLLCRGLLLILYYLHNGKPLRSRTCSLLLDFAVLVSPLLFSCTVLSPIIFFPPSIIAAICAGIFSKIYSQRKHDTRAPFRQIVKDFQRTYLDSEYIPAITALRVYVNVLTSIGILAVDFPQFPRRYAKAETYGTGVMDLGVGAFIFVTDLVLLFTKLLVKGSSVPSCWSVAKPPNASKKDETEAVPVRRESELSHACLISAVNRNQLLFFLLANVVTGIVNIMIDTIHSTTALTLCILHLYMFFNCLIMYILHAKNIVLKFW